MEKLKLLYRGQTLGEFAIGARPLAVGRGQQCDIVVHDPEVAEHHLLVVARRGTVVAYDLARKQRRSVREQHLPLNSPIPLGRDFTLTRVREDGSDSGADGGPGNSHDSCADKGHDGGPDNGRDNGHDNGLADEFPIELLEPDVLSSSKYCLLVGRGAEVKRYCIDDRPLHIGSARDNEIVLADRAVSGRHCRIEPGEYGLMIRDLGSRNGTLVNGVKVMTAQLGAGSRIRAGRTDLSLVVRSDDNDSASTIELVAESPAMLGVIADVQRMAPLSWPVLIQGESGTGKEGVARALHRAGSRRRARFVALNAGGLPRALVESELFGHERGSFTGAVSTHRGVFEQADNGTLFLDEIGELPLEMQARLLRAIESGEIRRVGGEADIPVNVRLICATHRDLRALASGGGFRHDLYFRITRLAIDIPPLRSRPRDIRALAGHFLAQIASEMGLRRLTPEAVLRLMAYSWPGNARELCNVLSIACAATSAAQIEVGDIELALERIAGSTVYTPISIETLRQAVEDHNGNQSAAARALGMARSTLRDRLKSVA